LLNLLVGIRFGLRLRLSGCNRSRIKQCVSIYYRCYNGLFTKTQNEAVGRIRRTTFLLHFEKGFSPLHYCATWESLVILKSGPRKLGAVRCFSFPGVLNLLLNNPIHLDTYGSTSSVGKRSSLPQSTNTSPEHVFLQFYQLLPRSLFPRRVSNAYLAIRAPISL